jgi:protein N-terminal glutamine amidohydrolase
VSASTPTYWPFYCEENIWHLVTDPRVMGEPRWVVFVSNEVRRVAMWNQRAARSPDEPVVWDYHVVLLTRVENGWRVWDLDSVLGLDVSLEAWLRGSFRLAVTPRELKPTFRCIEANLFRRELASDRRHMRHPDGTLAAPEPPWPCIGTGHNLDRFVDVTDAEIGGELVDLDGLERRFSAER